MNLAKFSRRRYTHGPTPIEFLPNFTELMGGPNIYMKRDDLLGLTAGGNKTRKLEFLMADALEKGADVIITCGAVQSNHCRLTLSAAVKEGLKCRLVLEERVPGSYNTKASGNNFLFRLLGVDDITVIPAGSDMMAEMQKVADQVAADGLVPYIIPGGGSNEIGALGYVACAEEIMAQSFDLGIAFDHIFTASGSAGTHAGLLAGVIGLNMNIPVTGVSVSRKTDPQTDLVFGLCRRTAAFCGITNEVGREDVVVLDGYVGAGYSLPTDSMVEAVNLVAKTEGILLDPVYTGKTMAGMIDIIRSGRFSQDDNVLFLHTGGSPGLYVYTDVLVP